jgi:hypothetical protein
MANKTLLLAGLCCALTLAACGDDPVPTDNTNNMVPDMTTTADMNPTTDMPATDMPATDMPVTDMPVTDMPVTDMPATDMADMSMADMPPVGELTVASFPSALVAALCAKAQSCCTPEEFMTNFDGADCQATFTDIYAEYLPTQADVDAGKLTFDADGAQNTLALIADASCPDFISTSEFPSVFFPYDGKLAPDAECTSDFQCAAPAGQEAICFDTCIVQGDMGDSCADNFGCQIGLYCGNGTCAAALPTGADCEDDYDCESTLCGYIDDGKCDPKSELGADCFEDAECESGFCDYDTEVCVAENPKTFCSGL